MRNPWELIALMTYEEHMSLKEVHQLQTLNQITKEQLADNDCTHVGILGIAGGNGLEHIDLSNTKKVYGIDVNKDYLELCRARYGHLISTLELVLCDLTAINVKLPFTNLLICNLIIEYIGEEHFVSIINKNRDNIGTISCVIQKNNVNSFVSRSAYTSHFAHLDSIHHDIDPGSLESLFNSYKFVCKKYKRYSLPNGKELLRLDFN